MKFKGDLVKLAALSAGDTTADTPVIGEILNLEEQYDG